MTNLLLPPPLTLSLSIYSEILFELYEYFNVSEPNELLLLLLKFDFKVS